MTARRGGGYSPTATTKPGTPPDEPAGASTAAPALPDGPALVYVTTAGEPVPVDREAVPDRRERRLFRALAGRAGELADKADERDEDGPKHPVGFTGSGEQP